MGPSGSGKTTLLNTLSGQLPYHSNMRLTGQVNHPPHPPTHLPPPPPPRRHWLLLERIIHPSTHLPTYPPPPRARVIACYRIKGSSTHPPTHPSPGPGRRGGTQAPQPQKRRRRRRRRRRRHGGGREKGGERGKRLCLCQAGGPLLLPTDRQVGPIHPTHPTTHPPTHLLKCCCLWAACPFSPPLFTHPPTGKPCSSQPACASASE